MHIRTVDSRKVESYSRDHKGNRAWGQTEANVHFTFNANKTYDILFDCKTEQTIEDIFKNIVIKTNVPGFYTVQNNIIYLKSDNKKMTSSLDLSFPGMEKEQADIFKSAMEPMMLEQKEEFTKTLLDSFS